MLRSRFFLVLSLVGGVWFAGRAAKAQDDLLVRIDHSNWGQVTSPIFGSTEAGVFAGAELFAGPKKFGENYFHGILPNGRIVRPAGVSIQVGMNPLGAALTPDGKYLIVSNDDERNGDLGSLISPVNQGGYTLSVVNTVTMQVVSQMNTAGRYFIGVQVTGAAPYTVWASGGTDNSLKLFTVSSEGVIAKGSPASIPIPPLTKQNAGFVSNYTLKPGFDASKSPTGFSATGAKLTCPAGSALSPDGKFLYVACQGDNSLAVIDTASLKVVKQIAVGYFPYGVSVSKDASKILITNWGVQEYKFKAPTYDADGNLIGIASASPVNQPNGFTLPAVSATGANPKTSSVSILSAPGGNGANATQLGAIYMGHKLDAERVVGDTHPSASAIVRKGALEVLYVTKSNSDSIGIMRLDNHRKLPDLDLSPLQIALPRGQKVHGSYPNALVVSPDNTRAYVAEAGINSIAVLDTAAPEKPKLLGRIPTGWYPSGVTLSPDGKSLYVINAKGIAGDINPKTDLTAAHNPTGVESFDDANYLFGTVQKIDLTDLTLENETVLSYNYALNAPLDTNIVPVGGKPSAKIKHVFFILKENKSFDSMLGNQKEHFGPFASTTFNNKDGSAFVAPQNTGVALNAQMLARTFATGVNYYSDSEESDAGHQFASSGTTSDYSEKTLLTKSGRGLHINKNFDAEDYPEGGYIFNNAARNGVSFKDFGDMLRVTGTDTGTSTPTVFNDPKSGNAGYPQLQPGGVNITAPLVNKGDVDSATAGVGQSYFTAHPVLAILGGKNPNGEPRLDHNYPGYNFNISDQRRAQRFSREFDRMMAQGTLPQFIYIYLPNDHGGSVQAPNKAEVGTTFLQQVADGDVALGMVVQHLMKSRAYYDPKTGEGSAIFVTWDDSQSSKDHIHPHRTPMFVVSPYAKSGYLGKKHYSTASIVKTEELLLGLPPNNYGDLFATDLRDLFQPTYNGITADALTFNHLSRYVPSPEGKRIWALAKKLDLLSGPDRDSLRLGRLARLTDRADALHKAAQEKGRLKAKTYAAAQTRLYQLAQGVVNGSKPRDEDD